MTLPLTIFLFLGTIQLFMMLQGRIMAEYAAFEAVRAGSRHQGDCEKMMQAGLAALLPNIVTYLGGSGGSAADKLADAWRKRINGGKPQFVAEDSTKSALGGASVAGEAIFWLAREQPTNVPDPEDKNFDDPDRNPNGGGMRLEVRMIYWFPLRIPFADWVMTKMFMAQFGLQDYTAANPLMLAEKNANWTTGPNTLDSKISGHYQSLASAGKYVFPIQATYGMRMMTPAQKRYFQQQNCGETPNNL